MNAAADLNLLTPDQLNVRSRPSRLDRERHQAFADHIKKTFAPRVGLYEMIKPDTIVCRCEEATAAQINSVASEWAGSLRAVKQCTRAGMGQCQGRICESTVVRLVSQASGLSLEAVGRDTTRPQIKPVTLMALSEPVAEL